MAEIAKDACWSGLTDKDREAGVRLRLARVFKKTGGTSLEILQEIKALNEKDIADFARWFNEAGYPTTASVAG